MPLIKSGSDKARSANVAAEIRAGRSRDQALAIAYRVQRDAKRKGMAAGGAAPAPPFYARKAANSIGSGFVKSPVAGRTDKLPMGVAPDSYVMPADIVSGLGQGNSLAGANALNKLFKVGPYGAAMPKAPSARGPGAGSMRRGFAEGGEVEAMVGGAPEAMPAEAPVDIVAAGGEYVVPPEVVAELGGGDVTAGHRILDAMVKQIRSQTVKTMSNLPGPKT